MSADIDAEMSADAAAAPTVTDAAYARIGEILEVEGPQKKLRVAVLGGGCSGFQYKFELTDAAEPDDLILEKDGVAVLIDPVSLPFLERSVIDYKQELIGARFAIDNPDAASTCGCGTSFSM
ncbi:MAG: iron-sulfur cluster insertion protein ErpA [Pseudomonadota bacterium]